MVGAQLTVAVPGARRSCWILYDYQPWILNPELEEAGVKIEKIKNREKDYQDIMEMM